MSNDNGSSAFNNKWKQNGFGEVTRQTTGKFSAEESAIVKNAVEEYCAMKQISVARLCSECDHKAELKGSWMEIAKRLPHRSVQSVYRHGLRQLHPFKRGAWTDEECEMLVDLAHRHGKKWATIQQKLNRSADSCRDKFREMDDLYIKGRWKENDTEMLKRLIREHLNADPTADIKQLGQHVEDEGIKIPWSVISKRMGKRSRLSCFKKWQKMTGVISSFEDDQPPPKKSGGEARRSTSKVSDTSAARKQSHASTASEAAAALVAADNMSCGNHPAPDVDLLLLMELATLGVTRTSDVNWDGLRMDDPLERWNDLMEEWQASNLADESLINLPLSEIAQLMLDRKTSAQRAAETVEAVDLPPPESLHNATMSV